jgi:hypothetical protein
MDRHFLGIGFTAAALLALGVAAHAQDAAAPKPDFQAGQQWSIKSPTPTTAKVVIGRVEPWNGKTAVHVSLIDVPIPSGAPGAGGITQVGHMPFEASALAASVDRLLARNAPPNMAFEEGYRHWQSAKGGIYTITVSQAIEVMFESITRGKN